MKAYSDIKLLDYSLYSSSIRLLFVNFLCYGLLQSIIMAFAFNIMFLNSSLVHLVYLLIFNV